MPDLSSDSGQFSIQDKEFLFDYENYATNRQGDSATNWMDIKGTMSAFSKDHRIDIKNRWGIDDRYVKEEIVNGTTITTVAELQLWVYRFTVTFTGIPDGTEKESHKARSWEPTTVVNNLEVGIAMNYNPGIVKSNANETHLLFLLAVTSAYETNDGDIISSPVGAFNSYGKQEVDAILKQPGTGHILNLYAIDDNSIIGPSSEAAEPDFLSGITWIDSEAAEKYGNVYIVTGIDRFQCAFWYTWSTNGNWFSVGPQEFKQPQASLTIDVHVLVIGKYTFEMPYEEIPEYTVDIDLAEETKHPGLPAWLTQILIFVAIIIFAVLGIKVLVAYFSRPKQSVAVYASVPPPQRQRQGTKKETKKKTKLRVR